MYALGSTGMPWVLEFPALARSLSVCAKPRGLQSRIEAIHEFSSCHPRRQDARTGPESAVAGHSPGENNAITDVAGVEVGVTTLISGRGQARRRAGAGTHRRDRHPAARPRKAQCSLCRRLLCAQRQWRDDRHDLDRGIRRTRRRRSPSPIRIPAAWRAMRRCNGWCGHGGGSRCRIGACRSRPRPMMAISTISMVSM